MCIKIETLKWVQELLKEMDSSWYLGNYREKNVNILNLVYERMPKIFTDTVKIYLKYETGRSLKLILLE
jgi:hypothetical protein